MVMIFPLLSVPPVPCLKFHVYVTPDGTGSTFQNAACPVVGLLKPAEGFGAPEVRGKLKS